MKLISVQSNTPGNLNVRSITERLLLGALDQQDTALIAAAAAEHAQHLANLARTLAASLEETDTRDAVRRTTLGRPGSWCVIDVIEPDGSLHRLPAWHPDAAKRRVASMFERTWSSESARTMPEPVYGTPLSSGGSPETLLLAARGYESLGLFREIGFGSLLVLPLMARSRPQGTIIFVCAPDGPPLSEDELRHARTIAAHCALALDKANLYRQARIQHGRQETARDQPAPLAMTHREPDGVGSGIGSDLAQLGLQGPLGQEHHATLLQVKTNQTHLIALIAEIVQFARLDGGYVDHHELDVAMPQAIDAVVRRLRIASANKGLILEATPGGKDAIVFADPRRVRQILVQLVTNAIKYTPPNGGPITVMSRAFGDVVRTSVTDHGPGIPAHRLEAIFEPFVPSNDGMADQRDGAGLGLAISRDLARTMHGDLTVESTVGFGSRFVLTLPHARVSRPVRRPGAGATAPARPARPASPASHHADSRAAPRVYNVSAASDGPRLRDVEREVIQRTMERTGQNQTEAARLLGISRPTLIRKLKSYQSRPPALARGAHRSRR